MVNKILPFITAILFLMVFCSCTTCFPIAENSEPFIANKSIATVLVTRDFGKELILERDIEIHSGDTALSVLQAAVDIETKYGGGFVSSINGISSEYSGKSGKNEDWFFYINGISANVGAGDYTLSPGDVEHWDFHDWSYHQLIPAIIGDYPQPFRSGYFDKVSPTIVVYEGLYIKEAELLAEKTIRDGVIEVSAERDDRLSDDLKQQSNLIIIAGPGNKLILELNKIYKKLGLYAYMESDELILLDAAGNISGRYRNGCSIIQATQNPWNTKGIGAGESVVWMITGTDENGMMSALDILINNTDSWANAFTIAVIEDRVIKVP